MLREETQIDVLAEIARILVEIGRDLMRIAGALESAFSDANRCGHGGTGLCMACIIQNDLLRVPRR